MLTRGLATALLLTALSMVVPSFAQELDEKLGRISSRLDAASMSFASGGGMSMQELSQMAIELESILKEMRQVEREYGNSRDAVEIKFKDESEDLSKVLGYMATLQSAGAPDYLLHPDGPLASIHANILVEAALPQLEDKLAAIAQDLRFWRDIDTKQTRLSASAVQAVDVINDVRKELVEMGRQDAPKRVVQEPKVLDSLFAVSDNLSDFVRGMESMELRGAIAPSFSVQETKGTWDWPASGLRAKMRNGVSISTAQSVISSPIPGTVRFANTFLDYGNLLIIEPEKGNLLVLAGFDEILVEVGDILKKDDVLGFFAIENTENTENSLVNLNNDLYVEMRNNGATVDVNEYFNNSDQ